MTQDEPAPVARPNPLLQAEQLTEATAQRLINVIEASAPIRRIRSSHLFSGFLGAVGFALFVVGVERAAEDMPIVSNPYGSIGVGIVLLAVTGLLLRRFVGADDK
jgi:hypothetical protein